MKIIIKLLYLLLVACTLSSCTSHAPLMISNNSSNQQQPTTSTYEILTTPTEAVTSQVDTSSIKLEKFYKADLYQMFLPKDWSVKKIQVSSEWLSDKTHMNPIQFIKEDKVIGELWTKAYLSDEKYIPFDMPNHSNATGIKHLGGFFTDVMLIRLERTQPAAANDNTVTKELHICFIIKDLSQVYDFSFNPEDVSDETALAIAKSFELVQGGVSDEYFQNIVMSAKTIKGLETWVISATPPYDAKNVASTTITLKFNQDMDSDTLNMKNIIVIEGKHSRIISNLFNYKYDVKSRILNISFIDPNNSYGTGNSINVYVTGDVKNKTGQKMNTPFVTGFSTP